MAFSSDTVEVFLSVIDHGSFSAAAGALPNPSSRPLRRPPGTGNGWRPGA